jgi:hypothetical protein
MIKTEQNSNQLELHQFASSSSSNNPQNQTNSVCCLHQNKTGDQNRIKQQATRAAFGF